MSVPSAFDHRTILAVLPHRYPFLLVDRVVEFRDGEKLVAVKNVTLNEPFFAGHFPGAPVMPGVLICEALAQASALLAYRSTNGVAADRSLLLAGLDRVRFRRPVVPGDQLHLEVVLHKRRGGVLKVRGVASVAGELAARAELTAVEISAGGR